MEINLKERNNRLFFLKKLTISNSEYCIYKKKRVYQNHMLTV